MSFRSTLFTKSRFWLTILFMVYIVLRIYSWSNATVLEDADGLREIVLTKMWLTQDFTEFWGGAASHTYVYSLFSAICALPGWSAEFGARLCTFIFSVVLFFIMIGLAKKISTSDSIVWGLFLIAIDPYLIRFSFSVLTEPSYLVMIYLGLHILWNSLKKYSLWKSILVGLIFGLAFAHRTEGIIFLVFVPMTLALNLLFKRGTGYNFKNSFVWTLIFLISFSVFAVPQIWLVSSKMGKFALNGRQVWQDVLHNPDGKSYEQKVYGLDYSPKDINISYLQKHSSEYNLESSESLKHYAKNVFKEFGAFHYNLLGEFFGAFGIILFGFGIFYLVKIKKYFELSLILSFLVFVIFPPLLHSIADRRMAIMIPIFLLIEGMGISFLISSIKEIIPEKWIGSFFISKLNFIIVISILVLSSYPLMRSLKTPTINDEYNPADYNKCIIALDSYKQNINLSIARIASRKGYLSYLADETHVPIPCTDYDKLIAYCRLNKIGFIFLEYQLLTEYPFLEKFINGDTPEFKIVYTGLNSAGEKMELYRVEG